LAQPPNVLVVEDDAATQSLRRTIVLRVRCFRRQPVDIVEVAADLVACAAQQGLRRPPRR
jgi:hypothetical protein